MELPVQSIIELESNMVVYVRSGAVRLLLPNWPGHLCRGVDVNRSAFGGALNVLVEAELKASARIGPDQKIDLHCRI